MREKMPGCQDIELLLQDYLDGYLLPSQREILEGHLRLCPECSALLREMQHLEGEIPDLPAVDVPDDLRERILGSIQPQTHYHVPGPSWMNHAGTALAALFIIVVGFLLGTRYSMEIANGSRAIEIAFFAPSAGSVAVVGDFNEWDPQSDRMEPSGEEGVWRIKLKLRPGVYEYGFLIDGRDWSKDPRAEKFLADGFGGENSILFIEG